MGWGGEGCSMSTCCSACVCVLEKCYKKIRRKRIEVCVVFSFLIVFCLWIWYSLFTFLSRWKNKAGCRVFLHHSSSPTSVCVINLELVPCFESTPLARSLALALALSALLYLKIRYYLSQHTKRRRRKGEDENDADADDDDDDDGMLRQTELESRSQTHVNDSLFFFYIIYSSVLPQRNEQSFWIFFGGKKLYIEIILYTYISHI